MAPTNLTLQVDSDLLEKARSTVIGVAISGVYAYSLRRLIENGIAAEIASQEADHNNGQPWPPRTQELRRGRPVSDIPAE